MASEDYWLRESIFGIPVVRETFQRVRTDAALPLSWHGTIPIPQGYALEKLLGTGSFGTVVLLRKQDDPAASPLALKILAKDILAQTYRDRLPEDSCDFTQEEHEYADRPVELALREAIAFSAAALSERGRQHVVILRGMFEDPTHLGFGMEFMEGGCLNPRNHAEYGVHLLSIGKQIFEGLAYLHDPGNFQNKECIVHRDIKAENILIRWPNGPDHPPVVKLADFGLSRPVRTSGTQPTVVGTETTMAPELEEPELWSPGKVTMQEKARMDVWSAGIVFLQLIMHNPNISTKVINFKADPLIPKADCETLQSFLRIDCKLSPAAINFFTGTFQVRPIERFSAADCVSHPYLS